MRNQFILFASALLLASCTDSSGKTAFGNNNKPAKDSSTEKVTEISNEPATAADAATILGRTQVPILCYHHIRPAGTKLTEYDVTIEGFKSQMKALADSGYHTILPDQLHAYLTKGTPLPEKPVMLTYDDTDEEQFSIAKPEMDKYGFKGVYFIMTISIGRPRYMSKDQIKQLSDEGHVIASHTWDHHRVDRLKNENTIDYRGKKIVVNEWDFQLTNTKKQLEELTGKPVTYFAYPFGLWNQEALPEIEKRGYKLAFQLSTPRDTVQPLYTVRRMIVPPTWSAEGMLRVMKSTFGNTKK